MNSALPRRLARRGVIALATLTLTGAVATTSAPSADALPCRDFCPTWDPFGPTIGRGDFWAYNSAGSWVHWYWVDRRRAGGGVIRTCGYDDAATGQSVSDACP